MIKMKYYHIILTITIFFFLMTISCKSSNASFGLIDAQKYNLVEIPVEVEYNLKGIKQINLVEYTVTHNDTIVDITRGRVGESGRFTYEQRRLFTIQDNNFRTVDAESLFVYLEEVIEDEEMETAYYYGRTSQVDYTYTISLVADESSNRVFTGKAKRLNYIIDIEGTPFYKSGFRSSPTETGFYIRYFDDVVSFLDLTKEIKIFIKPDLDHELRKTILFTHAFLLEYTRYRKYQITSKILKRE